MLAEPEEEFPRCWISDTRTQDGDRSEGLTELFSREEWSRKSWVDSANDPKCGFPLQSLPYCIFAGEDERGRPGVGIGELVLDLEKCKRAGVMDGLPAGVCAACEAKTLNALLECGTAAHKALRKLLMKLLDVRAERHVQESLRAALWPTMKDARLLKPIEPANYTDFYASIYITPQMWVESSGRSNHCCRITSLCPSAITGAPLHS